MRFSERHGIVFVSKPADSGGSAVTGDSINMGKYAHVTFLVQHGALTGGANVLTVKSGATDGTQTTSETFYYRLADADQGGAGADNYAAWQSSSSLTLTAATYDNKLLIIEMDAAALTDGQPFLTIEESGVANPGLISIVAILSEPRYAAHDMPTAIPA